MYKKLVFIFIAALMGACTPRQQADEKTLYVSILPLRSLVEEIVGDDFKIEVLVPLGASPETFEPTPRQFIGLNRAEMIFNVGLIDFETTLLSKIEERGKVVNLSQGIELIAGSCSHARMRSRRHPADTAPPTPKPTTIATLTASIPTYGHRPAHCRKWRRTLMRPFAGHIPTR